MSRRIVIDPITRIEGHLRIEVELDNSNVIKDAWSSVGLWRGIEKILKGRDPRDAGLIVQRFCGVCTYVHYEASILACEDALGIIPPANARIVRNLMNASLYLTDHIMHFYHLHGFDWIDVLSALKANPQKSVSLAKMYYFNPFNCSETNYRRVQQRISKFVESGRLGPFANAYWGNHAYKLSPEANLIILSHYLDALQVSKIGAQMMAILGGKNPHPQSLVIGGISLSIDELNAHNLNQYLFRFKEIEDFLQRAYIPDIYLLAYFYKNEGIENVGMGINNYLTYGGFPLDDNWEKLLFPRGVINNGNLLNLIELDETKITEEVTHSWYKDSVPLHPYDGVTEIEYTGYNQNFTLEGKKKYSWSKAPRYENKPYEVGPLARIIVGYAQGNKEIKSLIDSTLEVLNLPINFLFSTLGRTMARALETKLIANNIENWINELKNNIKSGDFRTWTRFNIPKKLIRGRGMIEAPRGALGHWININKQLIENYQAVVPSTWNCSPRDKYGQRGAYEQSLIGIKLSNIDQPLEILRTIHSFDPCMACAVHIISPNLKNIKKYQIV